MGDNQSFISLAHLVCLADSHLSTETLLIEAEGFKFHIVGEKTVVLEVDGQGGSTLDSYMGKALSPHDFAADARTDRFDEGVERSSRSNGDKDVTLASSLNRDGGFRSSHFDRIMVRWCRCGEGEADGLLGEIDNNVERASSDS